MRGLISNMRYYSQITKNIPLSDWKSYYISNHPLTRELIEEGINHIRSQIAPNSDQFMLLNAMVVYYDKSEGYEIQRSLARLHSLQKDSDKDLNEWITTVKNRADGNPYHYTHELEENWEFRYYTIDYRLLRENKR